MDVVSSRNTFFIGGEWVAPATDGRIEIVSPVTEEVIASVPAGSREDIDHAVAAARRALRSGPWPTMTLDERLKIIKRLRDLLVEHDEEFAQVITEQMGCPITQSRAIQVVNPVRILDAYLEVAATYPFRSVRRSDNGRALVLRNPVGVVAGIVPWNVPLSLTVQKLAPSLLTGCTIVLKPSPETPLDAYLVARLLEEAGCPPGVVNVVPADRDVSEYLVTHPGVDKVTFTGSSAVGRRIAEVCGHDLRHVTLELGGKSAAVVLDDADLDQTVSALRLGSFRNNGQVCTLKTRLVVPAALEDEFVDRLDADARLHAHRRSPRRDHADRPPGQCAPARARGRLHRDRPERRCATGHAVADGPTWLEAGTSSRPSSPTSTPTPPSPSRRSSDRWSP